MKYLLLIPAIALLASCQTEATSARFSAAEMHSYSCKEKVLAVRERIEVAKLSNPRPQVMFKDERNAMMYLTIEKMADMNTTVVTALLTKNNDLAGCAAEFIAMTNADAQKTAGINSTVKTGVGWGLGILGVKILADGFGPEAYGGSTSGDTWNVSGSRLNSNSGNATGGGTANASASGDGLGVGNTFTTGSGQAVGGLEPRTTNANGSVTDLTTGSNSGENSGDLGPVDVQPVPLPE